MTLWLVNKKPKVLQVLIKNHHEVEFWNSFFFEIYNPTEHNPINTYI